MRKNPKRHPPLHYTVAHRPQHTSEVKLHDNAPAHTTFPRNTCGRAADHPASKSTSKMSMSRPRDHVLSHVQLAQDMQEGLYVLWSVLGSWEPGCGTEALSKFDATLRKKTRDKHDILKQTFKSSHCEEPTSLLQKSSEQHHCQTCLHIVRCGGLIFFLARSDS